MTQEKPFTGYYGPFNWANIFTVSRVPLGWWGMTVFDGSVGFAGQLLGAAIIGFAFLTDLIDGKIAKMTGRDSKLGEYLDPGADKALQVWVAIWLLLKGNAIVLVAIVLAVELLIFVISSWHGLRTGKSGTEWRAKVGISWRMVAMVAILGLEMTTIEYLEFALTTSAVVMIFLGTIYGFLGFADFRDRPIELELV